MTAYTKSDFPGYKDPRWLCENFPGFKLISDYYLGRRAKRSQVPLINHIIEGVAILSLIPGSAECINAYCVHPMLQNDLDLAENFSCVASIINTRSLAYAMEYRSVANEYLSHRKINSIDEIRLSPLRLVNNMLAADKIQNYKDFLAYHASTHPRADDLDEYFQNWIKRLNCMPLFQTIMQYQVDNDLNIV